jgi:hypothetical protein
VQSRQLCMVAGSGASAAALIDYMGAMIDS